MFSKYSDKDQIENEKSHICSLTQCTILIINILLIESLLYLHHPSIEFDRRQDQYPHPQINNKPNRSTDFIVDLLSVTILKIFSFRQNRSNTFSVVCGEKPVVRSRLNKTVMSYFDQGNAP